jgi:putative selenium metabolism hydrolase
MNAADIRRAAAAELESCRDFLMDMIAIKSLSGGEGEVVRRVQQEMQNLGCYDEVKVDAFGNLLGRLGNGPTVIAFDSHLDTVDGGDLTEWKQDPWEPTLRDGVLYGRGASDQEGGMAAMVYAGKLLKTLSPELLEGCTVWMVGSVQEEDCDGLCWQYILREEVLGKGVRPDVVVLTEPTNLGVYRGHRGRMEIEIETKGRSCHGSAPERGINAVYKMAPIIRAIETMGPKLMHHDFLGRGSVTISQVRSTSPSLCAVADSCTINLDRRLTFGESPEHAVKELQSLPEVQEAGAEVRILEYDTPTHTGLVYPVQKFYPAWVTAEEHPAVRAGMSAGETALGRPPRLDRWTFSTNGVATAGMFGVPSIGFGPANEIHAHTPDDQIPVKDLEVAMAFYCAFPRDFRRELGGQ